MKLHRLATPVLILSLAGCAGPKMPFQHQDPGLEPVQQAYDDLIQNYVDPPDSAALLQAAYDGAKGAVASSGGDDAGLAAPSWAQDPSSNWDRFSQAYNQLTGKYGKNLGSDTIEYAAIRGMAGSLKDCQTSYFDPTAIKQRQAELAGQQQFGGVGVLMKNIPGHPTVLRVLEGPAKATDIKPGDEIVAVDGKSVQGETFEQVRNSIRGPQGSSVTITVKRPGSNGTMDFQIARAQIQAPIVDAAILGGAVGYLHLYSFPQGIAAQIDNALNVFAQRGVESIILDVRANTGGDQATILSVMGRFVKTGGPIETQIERTGDSKSFGVDPSLYWSNPVPLVVMADDDTQSGGEMFAKAMQEEGGYKVIGVPTAGCASSAKMFDLSDGSGIEISTGKIVSGNGDNINRVGVKPDQNVPYPVEDLAAGRDPQLTAAINAAHGAAVQAGTTTPPPSAGQPPASSQVPSVVKPIGQPSAPGAIPIIK
jgi:carboxyl-terminal processing protease